MSTDNKELPEWVLDILNVHYPELNRSSFADDYDFTKAKVNRMFSHVYAKRVVKAIYSRMEEQKSELRSQLYTSERFRLEDAASAIDDQNAMRNNFLLQINSLKEENKVLIRTASKLGEEINTQMNIVSSLTEENNKLREAIKNILNDWDKNNPEREQLKQGEGFEYWSPASSMLHSEFIAAARKLINKP